MARVRPEVDAARPAVLTGSHPARLALAFALVLAASLSACAPAPPARRDVVIGLVGEPASAMGEDPSARLLRGAVTESLVRRDREGGFVAKLARSVPTLANGGLGIERGPADLEDRLVARFEIREDALWQDGTPITAADVRFAHEEDRAAPAGTERRWYAERIERVEVVSDRVARVVYREGERWELYPLGPRVLPAHLLAQATPERRAAYDRAPVHAGPFAVAAWVAGYGVTLSASSSYVSGPPKLGRIEVRFFRDPVSLADALLRGDVDVAPSPALDVDMISTLERLADRRRLVPQYTPAMSVEMLHVGGRGVVTDPSVRRALLLAIDRAALADALSAGRVRVPRSYLVAPHPVAREVLPPAKADPATAAGVLAAAGFTRGSLGILQRGTDRLVVTLQVGGGSRARIDAGRRLVGDLSALGIAVTLLERSLDDVRAALAAGDFDLALVPEAGDDALAASERYRGRVGPWYDLLLGAAARAASDADRAAAFEELQRLWGAALVGIPLYQDLRVDVAPRALTGVQPAAHGAPLTWNVADWAFSPDVN